MQNTVCAVLFLLFIYFIFKYIKKERIMLFEILGSAGFLLGFFLIINGEKKLNAGAAPLKDNFIKVAFEFINTNAVLLALIVLLYVCVLLHSHFILKEKRGVPPLVYACFAGALVSAFVMIIPGYFRGRSVFITQILLIITLISLALQLRNQLTSIKFIFSAVILLLPLASFIPSFYSGTKSIIKSSLIFYARQQYILEEKRNGILNIKVKTPIQVEDTHCGMYLGFDILDDPESLEYKKHNGAKAAYYRIKSLDGIVINNNSPFVEKCLKDFLIAKAHGKQKLGMEHLLKMIYERWN